MRISTQQGRQDSITKEDGQLACISQDSERPINVHYNISLLFSSFHYLFLVYNVILKEYFT